MCLRAQASTVEAQHLYYFKEILSNPGVAIGSLWLKLIRFKPMSRRGAEGESVRVGGPIPVKVGISKKKQYLVYSL